MQGYFCHYCNSYLSSDKASYLKTHFESNKHKRNVSYYNNRAIQNLNHTTTAPFIAERIATPAITGGVPVSSLTHPGMPVVEQPPPTGMSVARQPPRLTPPEMPGAGPPLQPYNMGAYGPPPPMIMSPPHGPPSEMSVAGQQPRLPFQEMSLANIIRDCLELDLYHI